MPVSALPPGPVTVPVISPSGRNAALIGRVT